VCKFFNRKLDSERDIFVKHLAGSGGGNPGKAHCSQAWTAQRLVLALASPHSSCFHRFTLQLLFNKYTFPLNE